MPFIEVNKLAVAVLVWEGQINYLDRVRSRIAIPLVVAYKPLYEIQRPLYVGLYKLFRDCDVWVSTWGSLVVELKVCLFSCFGSEPRSVEY